MAIRAPSTATASGRAARRHPVVVRMVKRKAERWWAAIMRYGWRAVLTPWMWVTAAAPAKPSPTRPVGPPAQVHVLGVHEVGLVEPPELLEGAAAGQEARARDPAGLGHDVALGSPGL